MIHSHCLHTLLAAVVRQGALHTSAHLCLQLLALGGEAVLRISWDAGRRLPTRRQRRYLLPKPPTLKPCVMSTALSFGIVDTSNQARAARGQESEPVGSHRPCIQGRGLILTVVDAHAVCVYIYIYTRRGRYFLCMYIYIYIYICVCKQYTHIHAYTYTYTYPNAHAYPYPYPYPYPWPCTYKP